MENLAIKLSIYCAGMLVGACLLCGAMWFLLATDSDPGSPPVAFFLLIFSIPAGAIAGAVVVGITHSWVATIRLVWVWAFPQETIQLILAIDCPSCGRHATPTERVLSGLCAGCGAPRYSICELTRG
jgi:hypothetical protein